MKNLLFCVTLLGSGVVYGAESKSCKKEQAQVLAGTIHIVQVASEELSSVARLYYQATQGASKETTKDIQEFVSLEQTSRRKFRPTETVGQVLQEHRLTGCSVYTFDAAGPHELHVDTLLNDTLFARGVLLITEKAFRS
jgi:hypothetical protein